MAASAPANPEVPALLLDKCPFNRIDYAAGLGNIGAPDRHPSRRMVLLRRHIPGTDMIDGMGTWPYIWIDGPDDIAALREDFRHLVTVTAVTQPGFVPATSLVDAVLLKQHYVYDPCLPTPEHSRRARVRLRRVEAGACFEIVADPQDRLAMVPLYEALKIRRSLAGTFVDFPRAHFESIAALEAGRFFRVVDASGVGAMACGVLFGDMLQILHITTTENGLRWFASYLLMHGLQSFAREKGVRLLMGGMPDGGRDGLRIFKARWTNRFEPAYLLRIVNDRSGYDALSAGRGETAFFPAYRTPRR